MSVIKRNKTWHFYKRVPKRFSAVDPRAFVTISLHTDSQDIALAKAPTVEAGLIEYWESLTESRSDNALERYDGIRRLAAARGLPYRHQAELAEDLPELVSRVKRLIAEYGSADKVPADILAADLGGVDRPEIHLSEVLDIYLDLTRDQLEGKSADQLRRWKNPRVKAIKNLVTVLGDRPLAAIARDDALAFRDWWFDRITEEGLTRNSANKDMTHLGVVLGTVSDMKRLGLDRVFNGLHFRETDKATRRAFPLAWIQENLICAAPLAGLNSQARDILLIMVNTGCRPSEIAGLMPDRIRLADNIPHIQIRADGRQLKTPASRRDLPLVGVSLDAMRRHPEGFPRYRFKDKWSDVVNKFLRTNGLLPGSGFSAYSLRHSFEDRMLAAEFPDRLAADLMGHSTDRPKYGEGASLEQKLAALVKIGV